MRELLRRLLAKAIPSGSVVQQTVKSGIWMTVIRFASRFSSILLLIILARVLEPRHFGLVGIALLTVNGTEKFTQIGLNSALIQNESENVDDYLDTTWCLEAGRGLLVFGILFAAAPFIAGVFDEPAATDLIRVIGIAPVLYGIRNPGAVYFQKDLDFHKEFIYQVSGGFANLLVGVGYALVSPTVWALVFGYIATDAAKTVLSYVLHDYRPWPSFDLGHARELIDYGKWLTASSILHYVYAQGDDAFVGWFLSATALGFYQYAYRIADTPATELSGVIARVTFPAYSKLQSDVAKLRSALIQTTRVTALVAFPMSFGIALVAPSFVPAILGEDWTPMIFAMQLLAMYGLLHAITRNFGSVWKALDRPDITAKLGALRVVLIAALIWPATARWGFEGTALVVVGVYAFPMLPLDVYFASKMVEARTWQIYREYAYPFVASVVMFGTLWWARGLVEVSPLVEFLLMIPAGGIVYTCAVVLLEWQFDWGVRQNVQMVATGLR